MISHVTDLKYKMQIIKLKNQQTEIESLKNLIEKDIPQNILVISPNL